MDGGFPASDSMIPNPGCPWLRVALLLVVCHAPAPAAVIHYDFETGDLQGWQVMEGRFGLLVCDRAVFHNTGQPYNKQGRYFLSTLEQPDYTPTDSFTGVIESPVIRLDGPEITLLVGGGGHPETYVALCTLDGAEVQQARGVNDETMQRVTWRVPELLGKRVVLRVVDGHTGGWGHITLDDVALDGTVDAAATARHRAAYESVLEALRESRLPSPGDPKTLRAAVADLAATFGDRYPRAEEFLQRLERLEPGLAHADPIVRRRARAELAELQREALVANPLVSGQPLLYVVRPQYLPDHHNTATMFQTGEINAASFRGGGALKVLDLRTGQSRTLVAAPAGIVRDPEVHFSGQRILFSMRREAADDYHLYEVGADGSGLRQLTSAPGVTDIDPLYLPDGGIAFSSTREPKYCMCNRHIMANLFRMEADGANIVQIGKSTLMEQHGALMPDGRILYDRWEYVDRNFGDAQGLWTVNPDGTQHSLYWGNNTASPGAVLDAVAIPGTDRVVCVFGSCHDRPWGALAILDRRLGLDGRQGPVRTWPTGALELVGVGDFDTFTRVYPKYEDPYPLSDPETGAGAGKYFLCSRQTGEGERMGIYLLDTFGNEVLLHVEGAGCFDPMPLGPRPVPKALPVRRDFRSGVGYFYVADVYQGTHMAGVKRGEVRFLRVVESPEKRYWSAAAWNGQGQQAPGMNWHDFNNKRILGTVPVEADGSAYFAVPADTFVYFQLLDENGMMVQSMRSGTIVQSGEWQGCIGCHESRNMAPPVRRTPRATRRRPDQLAGWYGPPRPFSYRAEVQPVLDRHCVRCHDFGQEAGSGVNLAGDRDLTFNVSYNELWRKGLIHAIGAGPADVQPAKSWGSHASKLIATLLRGHGGIAPRSEDFDRLVTWIDLNAPYYPTYATTYPQHPGGRSPLSETELRRLEELTGAPILSSFGFSTNPGPLVSFERPELSPCLSRLAGASEAYAEALGIIRQGAARLASLPRGDEPEFTLSPTDQQWEARYTARREAERRSRAAVTAGQKTYDRPR